MTIPSFVTRSVRDFFKAERPERPICLVVDVRMPGRSGLELQRELYAANRQLPTIFITAHGGLARDRARRESEKAFDELRSRFDSLSSREREIMIQATAGRLNKQIAYGIGVAEATVKVHRSNLMRKMKARSLPELSRMADKLGLAPEKPPRS